MARIGIGRQKTDGDGLIIAGAQLRNEFARNRFLIQRQNGLAARIDALAHFEAIAARQRRRGLFVTQIVDVAAVMPLKKENVAEALCRDERDRGSFAFENRVGRHRRSMHEIGDGGRIETGRVQRGKGTDLRIFRRAGDLHDFNAPGIDSNEVCKRATDFDTDPHHLHPSQQMVNN